MKFIINRHGIFLTRSKGKAQFLLKKKDLFRAFSSKNSLDNLLEITGENQISVGVVSQDNRTGNLVDTDIDYDNDIYLKIGSGIIVSKCIE